MNKHMTFVLRYTAVLLLLVTSLALIASCGGGNGSKSGFSMTYNGFSISPDMEMSELLAGVKESYTVSESSACPPFSGKEKLYVFSHIRVQTYEQDGKDFVMGIFLRDDSVSVNGVKIGATVAEMQKAFGTDAENAGGTIYIYTAENGAKLKFIVKDGAVASIQLLTKLSVS